MLMLPIANSSKGKGVWEERGGGDSSLPPLSSSPLRFGLRLPFSLPPRSGGNESRGVVLYGGLIPTPLLPSPPANRVLLSPPSSLQRPAAQEGELLQGGCCSHTQTPRRACRFPPRRAPSTEGALSPPCLPFTTVTPTRPPLRSKQAPRLPLTPSDALGICSPPPAVLPSSLRVGVVWVGSGGVWGERRAKPRKIC